MRLLGWALILVKSRTLDIGMHIEKMSCENEGRDWVTNTKDCQKKTEARRGAENRFSLMAFRRTLLYPASGRRAGRLPGGDDRAEF